MRLKIQDIDYRKMRYTIRMLLKRSRIDAGLTQRSLGERLRKPNSYVHKVEVGVRRIDPLEFVRWCRACGVDPLKKFEEYLTQASPSATE